MSKVEFPKEEYKKKLKKFVSFRTISAESEKYIDDIADCTKWLKDIFEAQSFKTKIISGYENPLILAEFDNKAKETCLIYGHYDVQPASRYEGWENHPFKLIEKENKLIGRGSTDNKGQILLSMITVFELIKSGKLKYNIKFLIEGNEETGSPKLDKFVEKYKETLAADFILISDGSLLENKPTLEVGLRGMVSFEIEVKTSHTELHSGMYGGMVPNATHELAKLIAEIFEDETNKIRIPGFYDNIAEIDPKILNKIISIKPDPIKHKKQTGTSKAFLENELMVGLQPSLEVTGLRGGYIGDGIKTGIPHAASAKINVRTVENQNNILLFNNIQKYLESKAPEFVDLKINLIDTSRAVRMDTKNKYFKNAEGILYKFYKTDPIYHFVGGSIPVVADFKEILDIPMVLLPIANEDCFMHGVNENIDIDMVEEGFEVLGELLGK
ncbi:MAG TPA: M20/M25/M40 family metallo-hydrolase [Candidatus Dojkabacteria bacterium]